MHLHLHKFLSVLTAAQTPSLLRAGRCLVSVRNFWFTHTVSKTVMCQWWCRNIKSIPPPAPRCIAYTMCTCFYLFENNVLPSGNGRTCRSVCTWQREWMWDETEVWARTRPLMLNWYLEVNEAVRKRWRKFLWVHTHTNTHGKCIWKSLKELRCESIT